jgi:hypothetical protein
MKDLEYEAYKKRIMELPLILSWLSFLGQFKSGPKAEVDPRTNREKWEMHGRQPGFCRVQKDLRKSL